MKKLFFLFLAVCGTMGLYAQDIVCGPFDFRSYRIEDTAAAKSAGTELFQLKTDFPQKQPKAPEAGYPWSKVDFTRKPEQWANTVLDYCWTGNAENDFRIQKNEERQWYHVPNLDLGRTGREFHHGLIAARSSNPKELHPKQGRKVRNFSIGFYNEQGGFGLGQIYCNPNMPDEEAAVFPEGTVFFRLNFTAADTGQVPFLKNTMTWDAHINKDISDPTLERKTAKVRLIQVDVAVKTANPKAAMGWVMTTFVYNGNATGETVRERLVPVGVQWGNDPFLTDSMVIAKKGKVQEGWINPKVYNPEDLENSLVQHLGWAGRLAGPIDDPRMSMLSSHMSTSWKPVEAAYPPNDIPQDSLRWWFRNMPAGTAFEAGKYPLDFGFELGLGIRSYFVSLGQEDHPPIWRGNPEDYIEMSGEAEEKDLVILDAVAEPGLVGSKLTIFIGFIVLTVILGGLLAYNLLSKPK